MTRRAKKQDSRGDTAMPMTKDQMDRIMGRFKSKSKPNTSPSKKKGK